MRAWPLAAAACKAVHPCCARRGRGGVGGGERRRRAHKGRSAHARETATHCLIRPVNVGLARQQKVDDFDLVGPGRGDERRRACAWDAAAAAAARGRRKQGGGGGGRGGSGGRGDAPAHRASHIHPSAGRHWRKTATTREHTRARIAGARARKRARALTVFVALVHHFRVRSQDFAHARQVAAGGAPHELCAGGGAARQGGRSQRRGGRAVARKAAPSDAYRTGRCHFRRLRACARAPSPQLRQTRPS